MKNQGLKSKLSLELKVNMKKKTPTDRSFSSERDFSIIPSFYPLTGGLTFMTLGIELLLELPCLSYKGVSSL